MSYKVFKNNGLYGIVNTLNEQIIIPIKYDSIKILCGVYFLLEENGKKIITNLDGNLIFDLKNQNQFINEFGTFQILCVEEIDSTLNLYGEDSIKEDNICKISISNNFVSVSMMSKINYLSTMKENTGFDIDKKKLKTIFN
jgi:hypothetical protein